MARVKSNTLSYDIQSRATGESRVMVERSYIKSVRTAGGYLTSSKQYALFDTQGRRYERVSDMLVQCLTTDEQFHVVGSAEHIRRAV